MAHKSHHAKRRVEIAATNATLRANRTNQQQLSILATRPGNSAKETERLSK